MIMEHLEQLIDTLHMEDLRNGAHPSIFDRNEGYDMLIVRLPEIGKGLEVISLGFVITPTAGYFYNRDEERFELLGDRFEGPHSVIDRMTDRLLKGFLSYQDVSADMEDALYEDRTAEDFMTRWLGLKRDILRIERVLLRTSAAMKEVIEAYEAVEAFPVNHYVDLHEHMERVVRSAALQLSKLDYLYNFYNARTSDKMNRMIYLLTVISAVFLPLNLLVGFFGMNTGGLPFAEGAAGTLKAVLLMLSLAVVTSLLFYLARKRVEK
jgi:magnesium transporter